MLHPMDRSAQKMHSGLSCNRIRVASKERPRMTVRKWTKSTPTAAELMSSLSHVCASGFALLQYSEACRRVCVFCINKSPPRQRKDRIDVFQRLMHRPLACAERGSFRAVRPSARYRPSLNRSSLIKSAGEPTSARSLSSRTPCPARIRPSPTHLGRHSRFGVPVTTQRSSRAVHHPAGGNYPNPERRQGWARLFHLTTACTITS